MDLDPELSGFITCKHWLKGMWNDHLPIESPPQKGIVAAQAFLVPSTSDEYRNEFAKGWDNYLSLLEERQSQCKTS